jgi:hypothetical protein
LRHAQIKKGIGVKRLFPSAFLQQLDGARVFLSFVAQSPQKLGQFRIIWQRFARSVCGFLARTKKNRAGFTLPGQLFSASSGELNL